MSYGKKMHTHACAAGVVTERCEEKAQIVEHGKNRPPSATKIGCQFFALSNIILALENNVFTLRRVLHPRTSRLISFADLDRSFLERKIQVTFRRGRDDR